MEGGRKVAAQPRARSSAFLEKRGTKKMHHQFWALRVLSNIALSRPKKTGKIRTRMQTPISMHCRHVLAPLWSQTSPRNQGRWRWARSRPSGDATGRALLRPSQCPSHRQVATKTRDDTSPFWESCAPRRRDETSMYHALSRSVMT
ncbi:hypothetical protein IF1G_03363 [Cordyceps javanica]|uniref:Uncharacterized protein n=1 Tax=Cordyceps javanica TaxID=43265 RepID=A0A545V7C7_9HYPO|nr:hypothetical protein IF1G_03363 [Cordyceps javanica]